MPVRATVQPLASPGHALLRVTELDASPDGLTLSIQRQQGPEIHLGEDGWRRTEAWLLPNSVHKRGGALEFDLGPAICDRLAGVATIRLRVKEPDIGVVGTTVLAWPSMLTSGALQTTPRVTEEPPAPKPELPPPFETPKPDPMPELRAVRDADMPPRSGGAGWLIAAVLLVVAASGGYWAYTKYFQKQPEVVASTTTPPPEKKSEPPKAEPAKVEPPKKSIRDTVAEFLAGKPAPDAMLAKGKEFARSGQMAGAFLVWRSAAEAGSVEAQLQLATFYDPLNPQPKTGFTADALRAADWYERAALAGNVEAQRKYGLLLAKGGPGLPADPVKSKTWLQQAAAQNDPDAKKALDTLPK